MHKLLLTQVFILLSLLFVSKAFAQSRPDPLKCVLIAVNNLDTTDKRVLDSKIVEYVDRGQGKTSVDFGLRYKRIAAWIYSGNESDEVNGYYHSISIKVDGLARATSRFASKELPFYLAAEYLPKFKEYGYSAKYVVECNSVEK